MNPIRLRDQFVRAAVKVEETLLKPKFTPAKLSDGTDPLNPRDVRIRLERAARGPLFLYTDDTTPWNIADHPGVVDEQGIPHTPFDEFLIRGVSYYEDLGRAWDARQCDWSLAVARFSTSGLRGYVWLLNIVQMITFSGDTVRCKPEDFFTGVWTNCKVSDGYNIAPVLWFNCNGEQIGMDALRAGAVEANRKQSEWLNRLCCDCANPHTFLAKVLPKGHESRSVEWVKPRAHYVLLHKSHPMNRATPTTEAPSGQGAIERMAHSRRAHMRLLKSARFTKKRGQIVMVKASWIGPKEWQAAGGSTYVVQPHQALPMPSGNN